MQRVTHRWQQWWQCSEGQCLHRVFRWGQPSSVPVLSCRLQERRRSSWGEWCSVCHWAWWNWHSCYSSSGCQCRSTSIKGWRGPGLALWIYKWLSSPIHQRNNTLRERHGHSTGETLQDRAKATHKVSSLWDDFLIRICLLCYIHYDNKPHIIQTQNLFLSSSNSS